MVSDFEAFSLRGLVESLTLAVKVKVPARVGVPDRKPEWLRVMPRGRAPLLLQVYGAVPPTAFSW